MKRGCATTFTVHHTGASFNCSSVKSIIYVIFFFFYLFGFHFKKSLMSATVFTKMKNRVTLNFKWLFKWHETSWNVNTNAVYSLSTWRCRQVTGLTNYENVKLLKFLLYPTQKSNKSPCVRSWQRLIWIQWFGQDARSSSSIPHIAIIMRFHNHPSSPACIAGEVKNAVRKKVLNDYKQSSSLIHVYSIRNPKAGILSEKHEATQNLLQKLQVSLSQPEALVCKSLECAAHRRHSNT